MTNQKDRHGSVLSMRLKRENRHDAEQENYQAEKSFH
jgi:hypothetical protein